MGSLVCTVCFLEGQKALTLTLTSVEEIFLPATSFELGIFNQFNLLPIKVFLIAVLGGVSNPLAITLGPFSKAAGGPGDEHIGLAVFSLLLVSYPDALVWVSSLAAVSLSFLSALDQATFCFGISPT